MKRVCDYEFKFGGGVFNCCFDHVQNDTRPAFPGMVIECEHCGVEMILAKGNDGVLRWQAA